MTVTALEQDIIAIRRQRVGSLRLRGLTHEEIYQQLAVPSVQGKANSSYLVNPETGEPFDRSTITRDLQWLRRQNIKEARRNDEELRARQLAEIAELKRASWAAKQYRIVLECLEREAKLMGLDAPTQAKVEVDYTRELEAAGLDANAIKQNLVEQFKAHILSGAAETD